MLELHRSNMACGGSSFNLLPGLCFRPTDAEIVVHFLYPKVMLLPSHPNFIPDIDLSLHNPWELHGQAFSRNTDYCYFFSKVKDRRIGKSGYWKELDIIHPIFSYDNKKVGFKKYLVFNIDMGQNSETADQSTWIMQEYHLCPSEFNLVENENTTTVYNSNQGRRKLNYGNKIEWVLCRVYERDEDSGAVDRFCCMDEDDSGSELSLLDELFLQSLDTDDDLNEVIRCSF